MLEVKPGSKVGGSCVLEFEPGSRIGGSCEPQFEHGSRNGGGGDRTEMAQLCILDEIYSLFLNKYVQLLRGR